MKIDSPEWKREVWKLRLWPISGFIVGLVLFGGAALLAAHH